MLRDALDDELTSTEIMTRELAMDKEFIKLILIACKNDNIPRAIEFAKLLHNVSSFDKAIQVAEFYHLIGLREKIEILKVDREESGDRLVVARDRRKEWAKPDPPIRQFPEAPAAPISLNPLNDFSKPRPTYRAGLTRATPRYSPTRFTSAVASTSANADLSCESPVRSSTTHDGKRKRTEALGTEESLKRRALDDSEMAPPLAKQPASKCLADLSDTMC
jgi:chromosome transmission fidelity protein 4